MGYIGLLLNAPYKIDSMVWMCMWIRFLIYACFHLCDPSRAIGTGGQNNGEDLKIGVSRILGYLGV
jgi:hypothetical protein